MHFSKDLQNNNLPTSQRKNKLNLLRLKSKQKTILSIKFQILFQ